MSKSARKSKEFPAPRGRAKSSIKFDKQSFLLKGTTIMIDYLSQETKRLILKIYKTKALNSSRFSHLQQTLTEERPNMVVLIDQEAIQIIKEILMRGQLKSLKDFLRKISSINGISNPQLESLRSNIVSSDSPRSTFINRRNRHRVSILSQLQIIKDDINQLELSKITTQNILRGQIEQCILKAQRQLFCDCILMIIQKKKSNKESLFIDKTYLNFQTNCLVIFEQCYLPREITKRQLIQLIGEQQYALKCSMAINLYELSKTQKNYFNPSFIVCHHCMRAISDTRYPQDELKCRKLVANHQKTIQSQFNFTPFQIHQKFISKSYLSTQTKKYSHPFIEYQNPINAQELACNRYWCGECYLKHKRSIDFEECGFCDRVCTCFRCKKFQSFLELQSFYLHMGGTMEQLQLKSIFNKIFKSQKYRTKFQKHLKQLKVDDSLFSFELEQMSDDFTKNKWCEGQHLFIKLNQHNKHKIATGLPQQFDPLLDNSVLLHNDRIIPEKKDQFNKKRQLLDKKKYKRKISLKKSQNICSKIANMPSQKIQIFNNLYTQQFVTLKKKMMKGRIFRTNPFNDHRNFVKHNQVIMFSGSKLKKKQHRFLQNIQFIQVNPLKRISIQRQANQCTEVQIPKAKYCQGNKNGTDILFAPFQSRKSQSERKATEAYHNNNLNTQNYGSIWQ